MKHIIASLALVTALASAATPDDEKAFVEKYKKAFEAKDMKTLSAFLYTKGANADTVEMFTMMQEMQAGMKITSIELIAPSAEELAKFNKPMEMPDGKMYKMPVKPYKQLVIVIEEKSADGSSKSTSKSPVAEVDGKLVIPVPVPAK